MLASLLDRLAGRLAVAADGAKLDEQQRKARFAQVIRLLETTVETSHKQYKDSYFADEITKLESQAPKFYLDNIVEAEGTDYAADIASLTRQCREANVGDDLIWDVLKPYFQTHEEDDSRRNIIVAAEIRPKTFKVKIDPDDLAEALEGFEQEDLVELAKKVAAGADGYSWKPQWGNESANRTLVVDTNTVFYYSIDARYNARSAAEHLENLLAEYGQGMPDTGHMDKKPLKQLPVTLNADQLVLLRLFDLQGVDQIPSQELRKLPAAQTPWVKQLLDHNKILTPDIVMDALVPGLTDALRELQQHQKLSVKPFTMNVQRIWAKDNFAFIVSLPAEKFSTVFGSAMPPAVALYMRDPGGHPTAGPTALTIGWVRFTDFEPDAWIDEIQTDLTKKLPDDMLEALGGMNGIVKYVTEQFIREMRARGTQKIYMPNLEIKRDMYGSEPPESIYQDLPRKLRFQKVLFKDTELAKQLSPDKISPPAEFIIDLINQTGEPHTPSYVYMPVAGWEPPSGDYTKAVRVRIEFYGPDPYAQHGTRYLGAWDEFRIRKAEVVYLDNERWNKILDRAGGTVDLDRDGHQDLHKELERVFIKTLAEDTDAGARQPDPAVLMYNAPDAQPIWVLASVEPAELLTGLADRISAAQPAQS